MCSNIMLDEDDKNNQSPKLMNSSKKKLRSASLKMWLGVASGFVTVLAGVGLFLSMWLYVAPTWQFPLYCMASWYFVEVIIGLVILLHIVAYMWAGHQRVADNDFFAWLNIVFGVGTCILVASIGSIALLQKNILLYSVLTLVMMSIWDIIDYQYLHDWKAKKQIV
jgi:small-conductance mechanosensitive channel